MKFLLIVVSALLFIFLPICVSADTVDFESGGYSEGDALTTITTATNTVTFWAQVKTNGDGLWNAQITEVGGPAAFAFFYVVPGTTTHINDTPIGVSPESYGSYFLTDSNAQSTAESYYMQFDQPVTNISLDLYDFDNGTGIATLTAFSDALWSDSVGTYTVSPYPGDGSVVNLAVNNPSDYILSASLTWVGGTIDDETGIDNITFNTVPIPGAALLFCSSLIGIIGIRRKIKK